MNTFVTVLEEWKLNHQTEKLTKQECLITSFNSFHDTSWLLSDTSSHMVTNLKWIRNVR